MQVTKSIVITPSTSEDLVTEIAHQDIQSSEVIKQVQYKSIQQTQYLHGSYILFLQSHKITICLQPMPTTDELTTIQVQQLQQLQQSPTLQSSQDCSLSQDLNFQQVFQHLLPHKHPFFSERR